MTRDSIQQTYPSIESQQFADWSQAYMSTAAALGASWCDFIGERFHAYAHAIDDVSHCDGIDEAWKVQASFGQQTLKAYSEQAAKVGDLIMRVADAEAATAKH